MFFQARFVVLPIRNYIVHDVIFSNILVRWSNTWIHFRTYGGIDLGKHFSGDQLGFLSTRQWLSVSDLPVVFSTQLSRSPLCWSFPFSHSLLWEFASKKPEDLIFGLIILVITLSQLVTFCNCYFHMFWNLPWSNQLLISSFKMKNLLLEILINDASCVW